MQRIAFTVDAALLKELGDRLVGRPSAALAELIKNSYDADADVVEVTVNENQIIVADDGDGMTFDTFKNFWMRVGTTHKSKISKTTKGRRLTGSKGIGRLSVQFLADEFELTTKTNSSAGVLAIGDWKSAIVAGDLQQAELEYDDQHQVPEGSFPNSSSKGTRIVLNNPKKQIWQDDEVKRLAGLIWTLQSPFGHETNNKRSFRIDFKSDNKATQDAFNTWVEPFLNVWQARLSGKRDAAKEEFVYTVEFADGECESLRFPDDNPLVKHLSFDIHVYNASQRQRNGVKVNDLRDFLGEWGGVHVYDDGFRLPFYGEATNDWLHLERDHSKRSGGPSSLLPEILHSNRAMLDLPTAGRLFGAVEVSTSLERSISAEITSNDVGGVTAVESLNAPLTIAITRDRLTDNAAFRYLADTVRRSVHLYAAYQARRKKQNAKGTTLKDSTRTLLETLEQHKDSIKKPAYEAIRKAATTTAQVGEDEQATLNSHMGLLGALATAGISALAYEHEINKQLLAIEALTARIRTFASGTNATDRFLQNLDVELRQWLANTRATRALFSNVTDESNREIRGRLRAQAVLEEVRTQVQLLTRGTAIDTSSIDRDLRLPLGRYSEWSAIFQNVLFNSFNAMLDSTVKKILIQSRIDKKSVGIVIQDTGTGIDLEHSAMMFEPFQRRLKVSDGRKRLVIGGMGLGLSIVRMIASALECRVEFITPEKGYRTAFFLSWSEK